METSRDSTRSIVTPTLIGTGLQLLMVVAGHYSPAVAQLFAAGGMGISGLAGVLASLAGRPASLGSAAGRGAVAGGVCAFVGILVSYLLGDVPAQILGMGTAGSAVTGAIGGALGKVFSARAAQRA
ncbi:MAG TPA: hypothetical protein VMY76_02750 [Gemmatimonadales bacterium]|nr:hypothetical protein [Gemmatimonadales bacterium]